MDFDVTATRRNSTLSTKPFKRLDRNDLRTFLGS
jgi:hypothetical protein